MGRKYSISKPDGVYFVTFTVVRWIKVFNTEQNCVHFINSLLFCQKNKGLDVHAYCIMPNHVHLILSTRDGFNLSSIIRDMKRHTSIEIRSELEKRSKSNLNRSYLEIFELAGKENSRNDNFQLWQQHNHPIELDSDYLFDQKLNYIHNNPVAAELVDSPIDWKWSSAQTYEYGVDDIVKLAMI